MLRRHSVPGTGRGLVALATGAICVTGTLGQIVPPSIALVLLAGLNRALASPKGDIFMGVCEHF